MTQQKIIFLLCVSAFCLPLFGQVEISDKPVFGFSYMIDEVLEYPVIQKLSPGSPAIQSEMQSGDILLSINDHNLKGLPMEEVASVMQSAPWHNNLFFGRHTDGTTYRIQVSKARIISAEYKVYRYTIFLDSLYHPIYNPESPCSYGTDSCKNGYGYYVFDDTQAYYGELENNNMKAGLYYYLSGGKPCYYLGEFVNNQFHGKGTLHFINLKNEICTYIGDFANDKMHGEGILYDAANRIIYSGGFTDARFDGKGIYYYPDGTQLNGQWSMGIFQGAGITASAETPDNTGYSAEEIIIADKLRQAGLTETEIRKYFTYINTPTPKAETTGALAVNTNSELQGIIDQLNRDNNAEGFYLYESFDAGFSKYQVAQCFTRCSEQKRKIFLVVDGGLTGLQTTTLNVQYARKANDIWDHDAEDEADNHFPFLFYGYSDSYQIYNCNIVAGEIHTACSYEWQVNSADETTHYVHVFVYGGK